MIIILLSFKLELIINTKENKFIILYGRIAKFHFDAEDYRIKIDSPFYRKSINPFNIRNEKNTNQNNQDKEKKIKKNKKWIKFRFSSELVEKSYNYILRIFRTIELEKLKLNLDTGSFPLNGILYSLNTLNNDKRSISINFNQINFFILQLSHRPIKLILPTVTYIISIRKSFKINLFS